MTKYTIAGVLLVLALASIAPAAEDVVPKVFKATTGIVWSPGYSLEIKGQTLEYKVLFFSEMEKKVVTFKSVKITPTPAQWKEFREALDNINVWKWHDKYEVLASDGGGWELEVKYADKGIKSEGSNGFPDEKGELSTNQHLNATKPYLQLMAAIQKLLGGRKFDAWAGENISYRVIAGPLPKIELKDAGGGDVLEFLRKKGTEILRMDPRNKDGEMKFEYRYDTRKHRARVNYDRTNIIYGTALAEVLDQLDLDFEVIAEDKIVITDRMKN